MVNSNLIHLNSTIKKFRYREKILVKILKAEKIKDSFESLNLFFVIHLNNIPTIYCLILKGLRAWLVLPNLNTPLRLKYKSG